MTHWTGSSACAFDLLCTYTDEDDSDISMPAWLLLLRQGSETSPLFPHMYAKTVDQTMGLKHQILWPVGYHKFQDKNKIDKASATEQNILSALKKRHDLLNQFVLFTTLKKRKQMWDNEFLYINLRRNESVHAFTWYVNGKNIAENSVI